jgi:hypothetical protein
MEFCSTARNRKSSKQPARRQKPAGFAFAPFIARQCTRAEPCSGTMWKRNLMRDRESGNYCAAKGAGVGVGVVTFSPGDNGGVGVRVGVGVAVGVGLGMMRVGPFGVAVGVGLGVGAKSGVGETVGVGVGEELCAKAPRGGPKKPATARNREQDAAVTARTSSALAHRNRTTQSDAGLCGAVGFLDLRRF